MVGVWIAPVTAQLMMTFPGPDAIHTLPRLIAFALGSGRRQAIAITISAVEIGRD
jgi:hypothetical protein